MTKYLRLEIKKNKKGLKRFVIDNKKNIFLDKFDNL